MQFNTLKSGEQLIVQSKGRLDANWSDFFTDFFLDLIRNGEHNLVVDAQYLEFLSSAGIRSLIRISKELNKISGSLSIIRPNDFVFSTLKMTGLSAWIKDLHESLPDWDSKVEEKTEKEDDNWFILDVSASLSLRIFSGWVPFDDFNPSAIRKFEFPAGSFALGIGSPLNSEKDQEFGEFLVADGHLVYQNPDERSRPDYFLPMESFIPEMHCLQTLYAKGSFSHLLRFNPSPEKLSFNLADLSLKALEKLNTDLLAVVILAEIDGLVGSKLIQSPSKISSYKPDQFPEIRNWLSFTGDRAYSGEQALIVGFVANAELAANLPLFKPLPSNPVIYAHFHASVFPFQALQNGQLDLSAQVSKFFNGSPPRNLFHLIEDLRPITGTGASSFLRGAMWCGKISEKEVLL